MNSRAKGKRGELELAHILQGYGIEARRGQQYSGIEGEDVVGLEGIHIECKRVEQLNIDKAMEQSRRDAGDKTAVVMHKKNHKPWLVTMDLDDWMRLYIAAMDL